MQRRVRIGDRYRDVGGPRAADVFLPRDQSRFRVDDRCIRGAVRLGPVVAKARDRQHHEARIDRFQHVVAKAQSAHHVRPEVLDQHIGARRELFDQVGAAGDAEVDANAAFADVLLVEIARLPVDSRAPVARDVAFGRLDLDDVGAEIATASVPQTDPRARATCRVHGFLPTGSSWRGRPCGSNARRDRRWSEVHGDDLPTLIAAAQLRKKVQRGHPQSVLAPQARGTRFRSRPGH